MTLETLIKQLAKLRVKLTEENSIRFARVVDEAIGVIGEHMEDVVDEAREDELREVARRALTLTTRIDRKLDRDEFDMEVHGLRGRLDTLEEAVWPTPLNRHAARIYGPGKVARERKS